MPIAAHGRIIFAVAAAFVPTLIVATPLMADDPPPATAGLTATLEAASALSLPEQGAAVKDATLEIGHLALSFAEGTATPLLGKDKTALGFYFHGRGGWTYRADDLSDRETFRANLDRAAKSLHLTGPFVNDTFQDVVVLFTEPLFRDVWDVGSGATPAPRPEGAGDKASSILTAVASTYPEFDFRLAEARLNGRGRWVYVEMSGGLERVGYCYDDMESGYERLFNFRKYVDYKVRFSQTLSMQRLPGWDEARMERVVLTHAALSVETANNKSGTIVGDMTYHVRGRGTRLLDLELLNNRDPDSASWDSQKMALHVTKVVDDLGNELPFSHKYGELVVEISRTSLEESDVVVHFESQGDVFTDIEGHHADSYFILLEGWYPVPQSWAGEQATYTLKVRTKKPWRPVTSGKEVSLRQEGDAYIAESRGDHPSHWLTVLAGRYVTREETIGGLTIRVHGYAMAKKNVMENMPKLAAAMVEFYTSILGPMPAKELDIVEIPEYGFGISPPGVILLTSEAYKARQDEITKYISRGINARLAHEIAHQWFAHEVMPLDAEESWLAESFAEYYSGLAMSVLGAKNTHVWSFPQALADWRDDNKICADVSTIESADYLGGANSFMERRCLLYFRGPLVLHMLRMTVGNDRFNEAMKSFVAAAHSRPVTTDDLTAAFTKVVGSDMRWFFDQWYRSTGIPVVDADTKVSAGPNGTYRLSGTLKEAEGDHFKKLLVPILFDINGKLDGKAVFLDTAEKKFEFTLDAKPTNVRVDPYRNNIAVYR
jgi:Peptidase family M1 domain